ncbi:hypothetical protein SAMD00019534_015530, partial [Acytostelium subglobosum LB1]|uniref:hypothetical protein n=1 Tax=Acytostelium subglobosum LB1 TaxID=1410327 RepID=UPI000644A698
METSNNNNNSNKTDDNKRCPQHNKKQRIICYDCNEIVCQVCMATKHNKHDIDHVFNLNAQFTSNKKIKRFDTRLDSLWETLQQLAWSYDTIQITHIRVVNQFRDLHEYLMMREQELKRALNDELEKTTTSINNIIDEIANINANSYRTKPKGDDGDDDGFDIESMNKLVQSIQSSKSMDQFFDKEFIASDDVKWCDDQLMDFVRRGSQAIKTVHPVTRPIQYEFDTFFMQMKIIDLLDDYVFVKEPTRIEHGFRNHIFSLSKDSCSMLALDTGVWTVINDKCTPRGDISTSVVYARGNVYVFGGEGSPNTYSRFSLIEQKWHNDLEIIGIDGGTGISACYDGKQHIYLVGGLHNGNLLNRVDCFNIDTQQFSSVGRMYVATRGSYSLFRSKSDEMFVVGGYVDVDSKCLHTYTLSFDTITKIYNRSIISALRKDQKIQACYDGMENVFIVGDQCLLVNIKQLAERRLEGYDMVPDDPHWSCLYTQSHGLVTIGGSGHNSRYSLLKDKWIPLEDYDPVESRQSFGTCHIYH